MNAVRIINYLLQMSIINVNEDYSLSEKKILNSKFIIYIKHGTGIIEYNKKSFTCYENHIFYGDLNKELLIKPKNKMQIFIIEYAQVKLFPKDKNWCVEELNNTQTQWERVYNSSLALQMETLYQMWSTSGINYDSSIYQNLLDIIIEKLFKTTDENQVEHKELLLSIKEYFDEHFEKDININEVVCTTELNLTTFYRNFKSITGFTPLQYITNKRIEKAKQLLTLTSLKVSEVALRTGYQDVYYFSRQFRQVVGISPRKFSLFLKKRVYAPSPVLAMDLLVLGMPKEKIYPLCICPIERFLVEWKKKSIHLEDVQIQNPEWIICACKSKKEQCRLERLAKTSVIIHRDLSWREKLLTLGYEIGSIEIATKWLEQFDKRLENAKERIKIHTKNQTVMAIQVVDNKVRVFGVKRKKVSELLYKELELTAPSFLDNIAYCDIDINSNELSNLDADYIFLLADKKEQFEISHIKNNVKGKVYEVDKLNWLNYTAWGHEKMLVEILALLTLE